MFKKIYTTHLLKKSLKLKSVSNAEPTIGHHNKGSHPSESCLSQINDQILDLISVRLVILFMTSASPEILDYEDNLLLKMSAHDFKECGGMWGMGFQYTLICFSPQ